MKLKITNSVYLFKESIETITAEDLFTLIEDFIDEFNNDKPRYGKIRKLESIYDEENNPSIVCKFTEIIIEDDYIKGLIEFNDQPTRVDLQYLSDNMIMVPVLEYNRCEWSIIGIDLVDKARFMESYCKPLEDVLYCDSGKLSTIYDDDDEDTVPSEFFYEERNMEKRYNLKEYSGVPEDLIENFSDGYHTFKELYEHRITLFLSLLSALSELDYAAYDIWWSRNHHDGSNYPGWVIVGIEKTDTKEQISYHINDSYVPILESIIGDGEDLGRLWDGHTSNDVIERITKWFLGKEIDIKWSH